MLHLPINTVPLTVDGSLYNVEPAAGEPARFGIVLRPIGSDPVPLSHFELDFSADGLLSTTINLCRQPPPTLTFPTTLTGWNGLTKTPSVIGTIDGCLGGLPDEAPVRDRDV